jgi:hypothetical protein
MPTEDLLRQMAEDAPPSEVPASRALADLGARMIELRDEIAAMEAVVKGKQALYDELRMRTVPDALAAAGLGSVRLADGTLVYTKTSLKPSVRAENREAFYAWLEAEGLGTLIVPQVNYNTLRGLVKERQDAGLPLPKEVEIYTEVTAEIRRGK